MNTWNDQFSTMLSGWNNAVAADHSARSGRLSAEVDKWQVYFQQMVQRQNQLTVDGLWVDKGPTDLLTIMGRGRRETLHCAILAWLLRPGAEHGLGDRLLLTILQVVGLDIPVEDRALARVETEVERGARRADIVIRLPNYTVVIEAKVDASDRPGQCDDTYDLFNKDEGACFIFLTPSGRSPYWATGDAREAFKNLSFNILRDALDKACIETKAMQAAPGRSTALNYLQTLERQFPRSRHPMKVTEKVAFYLEHRRQIDEWAELRNNAVKAADVFFRNLSDPFSELATTLGPDVRVYPALDGNPPKFFFIRNGWLDPQHKTSPAAVAFEWHKGSAGFDRAYTGIWTHKNDTPEYLALHTQLAQAIDRAGLSKGKGEGRSVWWPIWYHEQPTGEAWWTDLSGFQEQLIETMRQRWMTLSPLIDAALIISNETSR